MSGVFYMESERDKLHGRLVAEMNMDVNTRPQDLKEFTFPLTNRSGTALVNELFDLIVLEVVFKGYTVFSDLAITSEGGHATAMIKLG